MASQNKDVVFDETDEIHIQSVSEDLSALYFGKERVLLSHDAIVDLTFRLASYVAYIEAKEDSTACCSHKESSYLQ